MRTHIMNLILKEEVILVIQLLPIEPLNAKSPPLIVMLPLPLTFTITDSVIHRVRAATARETRA